jgi:hypothetical protein
VRGWSKHAFVTPRHCSGFAAGLATGLGGLALLLVPASLGLPPRRPPQVRPGHAGRDRIPVFSCRRSTRARSRRCSPACWWRNGLAPRHAGPTFTCASERGAPDVAAAGAAVLLPLGAHHPQRPEEWRWRCVRCRRVGPEDPDRASEGSRMCRGLPRRAALAAGHLDDLRSASRADRAVEPPAALLASRRSAHRRDCSRSVSFRGRAMLYVVVDELVPESCTGQRACGPGALVVGFALMLASTTLSARSACRPRDSTGLSIGSQPRLRKRLFLTDARNRGRNDHAVVIPPGRSKGVRPIAFARRGAAVESARRSAAITRSSCARRTSSSTSHR